MIRDGSLPQRSFQGSVRVDPGGQPVAAWFEFDLTDVSFTAPLPEAVFANSFEP